ncbi:MAG: DUF1822 family protein [Coleofasciculaceae cyanobacterium]
MTTKDNLTFTVPLNLAAHRAAQKFHQEHSNQHKAKQVYLNTLAVYAVNFYLGCLGIETSLEESDSWNPIIQTLANTADLLVKDVGKLECLPVLPGEQVCRILNEVHSERIGYVAVGLNQSLTDAQLLGFTPQVNAAELALSQLISLENLLNRINHQKPGVNLSLWLENIFEEGWQTISALLETPTELAWRFRSGQVQQSSAEENLSTSVTRGKLLRLNQESGTVALLVKLTPTLSEEMDINVGIYPTKGTIYLPSELKLMVLDQPGEVIMSAVARNTKNIQLEFSGEPGESFSIKVALGEASLTEEFLI